MKELENYITKLEDIRRWDKTSMKNIALYFVSNLEKKEEIDSAGQIARDVGVSNAMITKFAKKLEYKNIHEIIFLQNVFKKYMNEKNVNNNLDENIFKAAKVIDKSRKIFFVGVSNGYAINLDFARKINRLDKWTYVSDNKYEQIGNSRLLNYRDVIVVTSVSFQHKWMVNLIKDTKAQIIILSSNLPKVIKSKVNIFFKLQTTDISQTYRNVTFDTRTQSLKILDEIFKKISSFDHNKILLQLTRYNK